MLSNSIVSEHARLALHLFFQMLDELGLGGHDLVQLPDLMFEVGDAGFKPFKPLQSLAVHFVIWTR